METSLPFFVISGIHIFRNLYTFRWSDKTDEGSVVKAESWLRNSSIFEFGNPFIE